MNNWTSIDEQQAKKEYLSMIGALKATDEFKSEWKGHWESEQVENFAGKKTTVKGDKQKYMTYWLENQKIINDNNWNVIEKEEYGDF